MLRFLLLNILLIQISKGSYGLNKKTLDDINRAEWKTMSVAIITSGHRSELRQTQLFNAKLAFFLNKISDMDKVEFTLGFFRRGSYSNVVYATSRLNEDHSKTLLRILRKRVAIPTESKHVTTLCTFDIIRGKVADYLVDKMNYKEHKELNITGKQTSFIHLEGC